MNDHDPFAPQRTAQEWAEDIKSMLRRAESDGYDVAIGSECCGCSYGEISLLSDESEVSVWKTEK